MPSTGPNTVYFLSAIGTVLVESPALEVAQAERIPIKAVIIRILANKRGIDVFPSDETDPGLNGSFGFYFSYPPKRSEKIYFPRKKFYSILEFDWGLNGDLIGKLLTKN
ncbi:hypothetical protein LEP1GSC050_0263 [Leptospira broomii serovar Hurstbridge str. 5399]|uniref:Uncharacterized protein n=1 Tax=Leptospira broomii serovar Hurstbridge str. 5399 TaxID=1049789 RepID=T0GLZ3_9LEPT|nr:hypothetical protein LEP1GSC050_0263 [Leptospira broomii serovar Hurstbridge str. 5399]